jgi:cell division protein FtsQ
VRAGALLALLAALACLYGLSTTSAFSARHTRITGATWTPEAQVLEALAIRDGENLFSLRTATLAARVLEIPAIRAASVEVALPDDVRVTLVEREPVMAWQVGPRRFLVDVSGLLFGEVPASPPAGVRLPVIDDRRADSAALEVGSTLDPVSLDAALRLGSLVPADLGSAATGLELRVDDTDGFVLRGSPAGWTAVFGFYTPTLRTTELIPGQVRLLRSLLLGREEAVLKVILADDRSGTYVPRGTPSPSARPSAKPSPRPSPKPSPVPSGSAGP